MMIATRDNSEIPLVVFDLAKSPRERWTSALKCLKNFSVSQFQKDFHDFIEPLFESSSIHTKRLIFEVSKKPKLLFEEPFDAEILGLSYLLGVKLEVLVFQNIIYDLFVSGYQNQTSTSGCTAAICKVDGIITLIRSIDFDYDSYWRRYSFLAKLLDQSGKEIGICHFPAVGTVSITTGLRFKSFAVAINARRADSWKPCFYNFITNGDLPQLCLRKAVESCNSYNSAVFYLCSTKLLSPAYLEVVGIESEGCVIQRDLNYHSTRRISSDMHYLAQTNVDVDKQSDHRQKHVVEGFEKLCELKKEPNLDWLRKLFEEYPVCNKLTFLLFLIQPETNLIESKYMIGM